MLKSDCRASSTFATSSNSPSEGSSFCSSLWTIVSAHMKSGSLRFEFELEVEQEYSGVDSCLQINCECAEDR